MATADLKKIFSGGGVSEISFFSTTVVLASGASGNIITLTPPVGKRVILNSLISAADESGITIHGSVSGNIVSSKTLNAFNPTADAFAIGQNSTSANAINSAGWTLRLISEIDEVITVKKDTGATGAAIHYSYAYGS